MGLMMGQSPATVLAAIEYEVQRRPAEGSKEFLVKRHESSICDLRSRLFLEIHVVRAL